MLPAEAESAGTARRFTRRICASAGLDLDTTYTAVLLTSETVTNAIVHGHSEVRLTVSADEPGTAPVSGLDPELDQLSPREREVLRLIARGYAYKEVAGELSISVKTVESHVSAVLRKLQLSSRHQLTRWASERRLL